MQLVVKRVKFDMCVIIQRPRNQTVRIYVQSDLVNLQSSVDWIKTHNLNTGRMDTSDITDQQHEN